MLTPNEIAGLGESSERRASGVVDGIVALLAKLAAEAFAAMDEAVPSAVDVPQQVLAYLAAHPIERPAEVEQEKRRADDKSDRNDAAAIGVPVAMLAASALGKRAAGGKRGGQRPLSWDDAIEREVQAFLHRSNLNMAADAARTYRRVVAKGIRRYKAGMENYEQAMTRLCREIARAGVSNVQYVSGRRDQADVAVRRHVQSMIRKAEGERTLDACRRLGYQLVEVSSHGGARPTHRKWQGKVFSLVGDIEIDGKRYKDFYRETGYGSVEGLGGANCRHSFSPYTPGRPRRWEHPDEEQSAREYKLEQRQRANERQIRAWKREAMACRAAGVDDTEARLGLGRAQRRQREFMAAHPSLQRRPGREQVYGADGTGFEVHALRSETGVAERIIKAKAKGTSVDVNRSAVNGSGYHSKYRNLSVSNRVGESLYNEAARMLRDRDGYDSERLVAVSAKDGRRIADTYGQAPLKGRANFTRPDIDRINSVEEGVVLLHNHPNSTPPSWADIRNVALNRNIKASVISCHDGTVWEITCDNPSVVNVFSAICDIIRQDNPGISDSRITEDMALSVLMAENEDKRWFRMKKVRSS